MSDPNSEEEHYNWDWRETPEWRDVEKAVSNLMKLDEEAGDPMVTDFVVIASSVPSSLASNLVGSTCIFSSSRQGYVTKGLLVEGMDIQREIED